MGKAINMLVLENHLVVRLLLDFIDYLESTGFKYDINVIVVSDADEAGVRFAEADIIFADVGDQRNGSFTRKLIPGHEALVIATSLLREHEGMRDTERFAFIPKPLINLDKIRADLERFCVKVVNSRPPRKMEYTGL